MQPDPGLDGTSITRIDYVVLRVPDSPAVSERMSAYFGIAKHIVTKAGPSFVYEYDIGDSWMHVITVSGPFDRAGDEGPRCTGGARSCPPEDCGGPWRYQEFLEAISDPTHEEHDDLLEWVGDDFDPEAFDPATVNAALAQIH